MHHLEDHLRALETFFSKRSWHQAVATILAARETIFFHGSQELSLDDIRGSLERSGPHKLSLNDIHEILFCPQTRPWPSLTEIRGLLGRPGPHKLSVDEISEFLHNPRLLHRGYDNFDTNVHRELTPQENTARVLIQIGIAQPDTIAQALNHTGSQGGQVDLSQDPREDALGRVQAVLDFVYEKRKCMTADL